MCHLLNTVKLMFSPTGKSDNRKSGFNALSHASPKAELVKGTTKASHALSYGPGALPI